MEVSVSGSLRGPLSPVFVPHPTAKHDMEEDTEHAESQDQSPAELDLNFSFQVANTAEV